MSHVDNIVVRCQNSATTCHAPATWRVHDAGQWFCCDEHVPDRDPDVKLFSFPQGPKNVPRLTDRGWVECPDQECRLGYLQDLDGTEVLHLDCVEGLVPPEGMVEAGAKRAYSGHRLPVDEEWDSELMPVEVLELWLLLIRAALIAAARWEREQDSGGSG